MRCGRRSARFQVKIMGITYMIESIAIMMYVFA